MLRIVRRYRAYPNKHNYEVIINKSHYSGMTHNELIKERNYLINAKVEEKYLEARKVSLSFLEPLDNSNPIVKACIDEYEIIKYSNLHTIESIKYIESLIAVTGIPNTEQGSEYIPSIDYRTNLTYK